jgi:recombination protein RecA
MDAMLKGFPRGRITEIWGNPGTGKSYTLAKTMAALEKDYKCLYVDAEFSLVSERLESLGVNMSQVVYMQDGRLEQVTEHIIEAVGTYDLIILDSLPKLIPTAVEEGVVGSNSIGLFARQIKHFEAKLKPRLARSKTSLVVINQARAGMGLMQPSKPQGGFSWEHAVDLRLKLSKPVGSKKFKTVKGEKVYTGHTIQAVVEKSRLTPPYISCKFDVIY